MKGVLIVSPDSTLGNVYTLARQVFTERAVEKLAIATQDYYFFDLSGLQAYPPAEWDVCLAVNEFYVNDVRRALRDALHEFGYTFVSVISPGAHIDPTAVVGENAVIFSGCSVGAATVIGQQCVLRPNVVISEGCTVGDYVTLEANVSVRESCHIGDFSTVCANSSLVRTTHIGRHCYLSVQRQYSGLIADMTSYSGMFQNAVRILPAT